MADDAPLPPPRREIIELPLITSFTDYDSLGLIKAVLWQSENGWFHESSLLWEAMRRDDRLQGILWQLFNGLLGLPQEFTMDAQRPSRERRRLAKAGDQAPESSPALEALRRLWPKICPPDVALQLLEWGHGLGIGLAEKVWTFDEEEKLWYPRLKMWHPRFVRWLWGERRYRLIAQEPSLDLPLDVGDPKWVIFTPHGYYRGWMYGLQRSIYMAWLMRQWALRDWARYSEIYGIPIRKAFVPAGNPASAREFLGSVASIGRDVAIKCERKRGATGEEEGYDLEILELVGKGWEGFGEQIDTSNTSMAVLVLGQNLTTEISKNGSRAAASIHENVRQDVIDATETSYAGCMHQQVAADFVRFNFGAGVAVPWMHYDTEPPEDKKAAGESLKAAGEGITALHGTGAKPDVDAILERLGIPTTGPAGPPPKPEPVTPPPTQTTRELLEGRLSAQVWLDTLADAGVRQGADVLHRDLDSLLALVKEFSSYEEMRAAIIERYAAMEPDAVQALLVRATMLAQLGGRWGAQAAP